jgi:predicted NAD-dependent protein-ADP-ribosyltransferase YbiA (DUF1768 family)
MLSLQDSTSSKGQSLATVSNASQVQERPKSQDEFEIRIKYAFDLLEAARNLQLKGAPEDRIFAAYEKANQAQQGLYRLNCSEKDAKKSLNYSLKQKKVAYFDRNTGVLTAPEKFASKFQLGQKLTSPIQTEIDKARMDYYRWDKKQKKPYRPTTAGSFVHFDPNSRTVTRYSTNSDLFYYVIPNYDKKETVEITQINGLKEKQMKQFLERIYQPRDYLPLFDTTQEIAATEARKSNLSQTLSENVQIQNSNIYFGDDLREESPILKKWQESVVDPTVEKIANVDPNNIGDCIYIFGTHNKGSRFGMGPSTVSTPSTYAACEGKYATSPLNLTAKNFQDLGLISENNFLSNAYQKPLYIPGDPRSPYKTVTHYLFAKRIEKSPNLSTLEQSITQCNTAYDFHFFYRQHTFYFRDEIPSVFHDLDNELKKALFYKFVGSDGKPNEEGIKLLATGNKKLYAGYEIGDPYYGMIFLYQNKKTGERPMEGANKLGKCLMELRDILREQEQLGNQNQTPLVIFYDYNKGNNNII